jgi:hypothetical protein
MCLLNSIHPATESAWKAVDDDDDNNESKGWIHVGTLV